MINQLRFTKNLAPGPQQGRTSAAVYRAAQSESNPIGVPASAVYTWGERSYLNTRYADQTIAGRRVLYVRNLVHACFYA
jgi:hypothetical protein